MALKALMLTMALALAGCCGLPQRCEIKPCWYDEGKGPGVPYDDPNEPEPWKRHYYLGRDPSNLKRVIRLYPSTSYYPPSPYVYQPGPESWTDLYRWGIYRPYIFPHK